MNREIQILKFAAALFGGRWSIAFGLGLWGIFLLVAAAVLLIPAEVLGKPYLLVPMAGMLMAVGIYCCVYGIVDLPQLLERNQALRLAPYGEHQVFLLRQRLIWIAISMLFALFVLQPYTLLLDRSYDRPHVALSEVTMRDVLVTLIVLLQGVLYVWILARWAKVPFNLMFFPFYMLANVSTASRRVWWPFFAFAIVLVGVLLWRKLASGGDPAFSDRAKPDDFIDGEESSGVLQRHKTKRWRSFLSSLASGANSRWKASHCLTHLRSVTDSFAPVLTLILAFVLVVVRNWAESGGFSYIWIMFASVLAPNARPIPLMPGMLLPMGISRKNVARTLLWVWFRRDLTLLIPASLIASVWVAIASRFDLWMPFSSGRQFPWIEPDALMVHPSVGVFSFVALYLGLALCTRLFFAATPAAASNQLRFAWVRGIFVFVPPIAMFAIELYLRSYTSQFPMLDSLTLRTLLAGCVVLPSFFTVYFFVMRRTWRTANIAKVAETYVAAEVKGMQTFFGPVAAGARGRH